MENTKPNKTVVRCTFAGHRDFQDDDISPILEALEHLTAETDTLICYVGGMGEFDRLAERASLSWRRLHPEKTLELYLVLPYMKKAVQDREDMARYDDIIIVEEAETAHYKRAITIRNRWMVDRSDAVIARIWRDFGGAYNTVAYAEKCGKNLTLIK